MLSDRAIINVGWDRLSCPCSLTRITWLVLKDGIRSKTWGLLVVGARNPKHMRDMVMVVGPLIPEVFNNLASLELELFFNT